MPDSNLVRVKLTLPKESMDRLQALATKIEGAPKEVVSNALRLYEEVIRLGDEYPNGKVFVIVEDSAGNALTEKQAIFGQSDN
jgi:hypothetical protein